jgi:hypothetical protein
MDSRTSDEGLALEAGLRPAGPEPDGLPAAHAVRSRPAAAQIAAIASRRCWRGAVARWVCGPELTIGI